MRAELPTPFPHQIEGARFLADRRAALLADEPRVGKTGTAIIAADLVLARTILVITTASGCGVWQKGFADWSTLGRSVEVITPKTALGATGDVLIVGWPSLADPKVQAALLQRRFDLIVSDEDHYAKSLAAKRTQALYANGLAERAARVWCLTGTPFPHSPADGFPRLWALAPDRLAADEARDWPDVSDADDFLHRYCVVRMKKLSQFNRIPVIVGGQNEAELAARMDGFYLRRTQQDVGIRAPIYETLPLIVSDAMRRKADGKVDAQAVLEAAGKGATRDLEMHLGPLRRLTGEIKAFAVIDAVREEFECGLDRIVLMYWHRDVGDALIEGLAHLGVTRIDGAATAKERQEALDAFNSGEARVFLGQIVAAGEAIDLSASAVLWFVETSLVPKDMAQAALRITNHTQTRQAIVKVVTLAGSIDEALQARLMTLWTTIRKVMA